MSWPRSVGQIPIHYAHENTGRPATTGGALTTEEEDVGLHGPDNVQEKYTSKYLDLELGPQFAFGHGGGYASFAHGAPRISASEFAEADFPVRLEIDVTNASDRVGDEVVQVYVEDFVASIAPPVRRLVAFERRTIGADETTSFAFELRPEAFGFWTTDAATADFVIEPGAFRLHVGPTQAVELRVR